MLLCYKEDKFYEETTQTKEIYRFLEKYDQPEDVNSVEDALYEVLINCEMEMPPLQIIQRLDQIGVTFPTQKMLIQALNLITEFYNHTRLWSNNGFTHAELFEREKSI